MRPNRILEVELAEDTFSFGSHDEHFFWKHFNYRGRTLYHYTKQEAFISILSDRQLRATNVRHFSDYSEVEYAYKILGETVSSLMLSARYELERAFLSELREIARPNHFHTYAMCFSTKPDDLNQWRSYASPGFGYCIGFAADRLMAYADRNNGRMGRCIYSRLQQQEIVRNLLDRFVSDLGLYFPYYGAGEINEDLVKTRAQEFSNSFERIAPLFKNPAFKDESEVRIVFDVNPSTRPIRFYSGSTAIVPYVELPFEIADRPALSPRSVMAKASSNPDFISQSTNRFLQYLGYITDLVNTSSIPFREGV